MENRFGIKRGDITKENVDAIVNAAKTSLLGGGGVDGAIHCAAGPELLAECRALGGCPTGKAKITKGYRLPSKYVIHTPGPSWCDGLQREPELLAESYRSCLELAEQYGCRTISFPSISTGIYRFPLEQAAIIAIATITDFLAKHELPAHVNMVCFDARTQEAYQKAWIEHQSK